MRTLLPRLVCVFLGHDLERRSRPLTLEYRSCRRCGLRVLLLAALLIPAAGTGAREAIAGDGPPVNRSSPQLAGIPTKGETLTLDAGGWGGEHLVFDYQWERCDRQGSNCSSIPGAKVVTQLRTDEYTLGQADVGRQVRAMVTASNAAGTTIAFSSPTAVVAGAGFAAGRVARYTVFSPALHRAQEVLAYLPPGYRRGSGRYPVLYLLHGYPGDPTSFVAGVPAGAAEDALLAKRLTRPMILVMPSGKPDPPADTAWVDGAGPAAAWETFVARDVVRWTDTCFSTDPRPSARGIAGLSDGAYGALNIALHHPGEFHLVESWSGYTHADDTLVNVYGGDPARLAYNSPADYLSRVAPALRRAGVFFWLYIGNQDGGLAENQQFAAALTAARVPSAFTVFEGSHLPSFYRAHLPLSLQVASSRLTATRATGHTRVRGPLPPSCLPALQR